MRVGIDAQVLLEPSAGITYYTQGILTEILKQDSENHYDLFLFRLFPKSPARMFENSANLSYRYQRFFPYKLFYKFHKWGIGIPLEIFFGRHDLYFFPNFVAYPHRVGKNVVVVHDLTFERVPQYVDRKNVDFLKKFVPPSVAQADHVIVNSKFTRDDLIGTYRVPANKVTVVHPGIDPKFFFPRSEKERVAVTRKYGIKKPFLLYLGTLEPRKNVPAVVRAYAALMGRKDFNLVLAGKTGWMSEEIFRTVEDLGLREDVIFTGYVPDEDRPRLLSAAEVFVYPSFFEGFGMPVVEAQACGTPVITSNTTALPEAAGGAAILVDPEKVEEIAAALEQLTSSSSSREKFRKAGILNSRRFRWRESARKVIEIFRSLE